jgi:hypothetical protein
MLETAGGMGRHMGVFSCTMLKYGPLAPITTLFFLTFSRYDQRWRHHRHGYLLHSIVHPRISRVRWRISDSLGTWPRVLTLRALYLA